jgi:hypothetical protein
VNDALRALGTEELRAAVRAVLREVLPADVVAGSAPSTPSSGDVVIAGDADLTAFVRRVAAMCEDPAVRAALQDGRHGFRFAAGSGGFEAQALTAFAPQPPKDSSVEVRAERASKPLVRVERGAVTERMVQKASTEGSRLVLARGAVLTPLARDKARSLGVEIEKEH